METSVIMKVKQENTLTINQKIYISGNILIIDSIVKVRLESSHGTTLKGNNTEESDSLVHVFKSQYSLIDVLTKVSKC